jgi:hypothetical protein
MVRSFGVGIKGQRPLEGDGSQVRCVRGAGSVGPERLAALIAEAA